jgi:hypothetical protein
MIPPFAKGARPGVDGEIAAVSRSPREGDRAADGTVGVIPNSDFREACSGTVR